MSATPTIPSLADITRPQSPTVGDQPVKIDAQRPELLLRAEARPARHLHPAARQRGLRFHRPVGVRQEHVPAHAQPDERHHRGHARRGHGAHRRRQHLRPAASTWSGCGAVSAWSFRSRTRFRSRSSRTSPTACAINGMATSQGRRARARRVQPAGRRALGRSEGSAARLGARAFRRPAAAAVHRARAGGASRRCC